MQEIQRKFADDPVRQQEEMQKLYAEAKFNPIAGCLPMLLQMPIFIALFQVLQEMGTRTHGSTYEFYNLVPSLITTPSQAFAEGIGAFIPYVILMIIFAGATFLPMVLQQRNNEGAQKKNFFQGLKTEFKKIVWPDQETVTKQTIAVLAVSIALGLIIAILDLIIKFGLSFIL